MPALNLQDNPIPASEKLYRIHWKSDCENGGSFKSPPLEGDEVEPKIISMATDPHIYDIKVRDADEE